MITIKEQNELFTLIAKQLNQNISCIAFGGTAMMFYGYKQATKDIDLVFSSIKERKVFIKAIEKLGYKEDTRLLNIYSKSKRADTTAPVMYKLKDERFDLFAEVIFKFRISPFVLKRITQIQDFQETHLLSLQIISPEDLVLLKCLTDRENDFEDILTILHKTENFNWKFVMTEALQQKEGWILLDVEKTLQRLKKYIEIPQIYFDMLYGKA